MQSCSHCLFSAHSLAVSSPLLYLWGALLPACLTCPDFTLRQIYSGILVWFFCFSWLLCVWTACIICVHLPKMSFLSCGAVPRHLFSCSSPCPLFSKHSLYLSPLSSTPSQDKQPLFWGMSAICSKEHPRSWMLFRTGRKAFKILCSHSFFPHWSMLQIFLQIFRNFSLKHTEMLRKGSTPPPHNCFLSLFLISLFRELRTWCSHEWELSMSNIFELHSNTQHTSGLNTPNLAFGYHWVCLERLSRRKDPNTAEWRTGVSVCLRRRSPWGEISTRAVQLLLYGSYFFPSVPCRPPSDHNPVYQSWAMKHLHWTQKLQCWCSGTKRTSSEWERGRMSRVGVPPH